MINDHPHKNSKNHIITSYDECGPAEDSIIFNKESFEHGLFSISILLTILLLSTMQTADDMAKITIYCKI